MTIAARPSIPSYRDGDRCPGCGRSNWFVHRSTAECAFCFTAMPLADIRYLDRPIDGPIIDAKAWNRRDWRFFLACVGVIFLIFATANGGLPS